MAEQDAAVPATCSLSPKTWQNARPKTTPAFRPLHEWQDAARRGRAGPRSQTAPPAADVPLPMTSSAEGPLLYSAARGDVAQLEEHRVRIAGVRGSSPLISTIHLPLSCSPQRASPRLTR